MKSFRVMNKTVVATAVGMICSLALFAQAPVAAPVTTPRLEIIWPTPNTAFFDGKDADAFIQPTASGVLESGEFGCVRSDGGQFHEGIDIKPTAHNRQGEATDPVFAAMTGVVRYINRTPGDSSYGRYIVIEHPDAAPGIYTLYAHLSKIEAGLKPGSEVLHGQTIATMGRSASGYAIPKDRAHLHFEMGVWLTREFQSWYDWKKFGSRNEHGIWNGMNLLGFDPLDFLNDYRAGRVGDFITYFARMQPAVKLRIATAKIPDFVQRYPALQTKPLAPGEQVGGWEVLFNDMGLPFRWTPLPPMEMLDYRAGEVRVIEASATAQRINRCKSLVFSKRGRLMIGKDLESVLQLVFGLRREL